MKLDLQKARAKTLADHFKKAAAHHTKMAGHHEAIMKAHEGAQAHHESMMGKGDDGHGHHKAKAAFHKTMASHHEKLYKTHSAHAEHHSAMADAHNDGDADDQKKTMIAAFAKFDIEIEEQQAAAVVDPPQPTQTTGAPPVSKTQESTATTPTTPSAAAATASAAPPSPVAAATAAAAGEVAIDLQKSLHEGLQLAVKNGLSEILQTPEFKKTIQEELANALLKQLGQQTAAAAVKTFAVPRSNENTLEASKTVIASGATPQIDTKSIDPQFAHLFQMGDN